MLTATLLLPVAVIAAIAAAGLFPADATARARRLLAVVSPAAVLPAAALALRGEPARLEVPWLLFGSVFALDALGRAMLLVSALLYGAALIAVAWRRRDDAGDGVGALSAFLLACYAGNIGVYLAAETVTFYLSFAVMSFAAAGLVIHHRTQKARRATVIYLLMSVLSETALLAGFIMVVNAGGRMLADAPQAILTSAYTGAILVLLLIGFGIKAGTVPLHVWLPLAHPAAPPAASAVLSGAMVAAGVVGWLRFFPSGADAVARDSATALAWVLLALSLLGTFVTAFFGVVQDDPKVILAYSTVSQIGFLGAVVAVGMLVPGAAGAVAAAVVLYLFHHGLAKGALFLGVPVVQRHGRGPIGVVVLIGSVWAALALAGAPWTSGAFAKYVSKNAAADLTLWGVGLDKILPLVATGSTVLLLRLAWVMLRGERTRGARVDGRLGGWLLICLAGVVLPWRVGEDWLPLSAPTWDAATIWDMTWPILLGLLLGLPVWFLAAHHRLPAWFPRADGTLIPPGDLVEVGESLVRRVMVTGGRGLDRGHAGTQRIGRASAAAGGRIAEAIQRGMSAADDRVRAWTPTGMLTLGLLGAGAVLVLIAWGWFP